MLLELSFLAFVSFASLFLMRKVAKSIGLVDKPNERKLHSGAMPLVGGIAISLTMSQFILSHSKIIPHSELFLASILTLNIVGALDDKFDINFKIRLLIQALLSMGMMYFADIKLDTMGNLLGMGDVHLGALSYLVTIFAVIGAINAFNMVDGIDGLLGGLATVTFSAVTILLNINSQYDLAYLCLAFIAAIIPYILMNLGMLGRKRKVFMGDAGSMMIGFTMIWLLLCASQNSSATLIRPVTALWLIAIPLMDMAAIMFRRVRRGDSPFKPDREHLHHIFQRLGYTSRQTLAIICMIASAFAGFGIYGELANIPESTMFFLFMLCFIAYTVSMSYVWRITSWLRRCRNLPEKTQETSI